MKKLRFNCLRCAHCCKDIIKTVHVKGKEVSQGLHLFPAEEETFRKHASKYGCKVKILPKWIVSTTKEIIAYQLVNERCPFLDGKSCRIYHSRPLSCHLFPRTSWGGIDKTCEWVRKYQLDRDLKEEVIIISPQLDEAFQKITSKLYEQVKDLSEKKIILYNHEGEERTQVSLERFLAMYKKRAEGQK